MRRICGLVAILCVLMVPVRADAATLPSCRVFEDGSATCTFANGTVKNYGNDPKSDRPCWVSKQKATVGRPAVSTPDSYWPNWDLRLIQTRGSEPYVCLVISS